MNMGVFPPPPRNLPLLTSKEKALVLGGDFQTQQEFARTSYTYLLASAPQLILTRPQVYEEEDRLASQIIPPDIWEPDPVRFAALSQFHPAWWRSPAVRAAFRPTVPKPNDQTEFITIPLPEVISISALETALACPCRFYLNALLGLEELPDIVPGLSPLERGSVMHSVLQTFTGRFLEVLEDTGVWDDGVARQQLQAVAAEYMSRGQENPHWEAEMARWLEGEEALLRQWLGQEKQRFLEGWRWLAMETAFTGLRLPGWPTRVRGRLDRVDTHQTQGVMLWDYKTGAVPGQKEIREDPSQFQLSGYLLAVAQGLTAVPPHPEARAGIIGLKSSREDHLKFEDFNFSADNWREILDTKLMAVARLGARVGEGDFHPDPSVPPPARNNSCQYCPFALLCGHRPET
jgi:RecB family exonuclease